VHLPVPAPGGATPKKTFLPWRKTFLKEAAALRQPCPQRGGGVNDAFVVTAQETFIFFIVVMQIIQHYRQPGDASSVREL